MPAADRNSGEEVPQGHQMGGSPPRPLQPRVVALGDGIRHRAGTARHCPASGNACTCQSLPLRGDTAGQTPSVLPCRPGICPVIGTSVVFTQTAGRRQVFFTTFHGGSRLSCNVSGRKDFSAPCSLAARSLTPRKTAVRRQRFPRPRHDGTDRTGAPQADARRAAAAPPARRLRPGLAIAARCRAAPAFRHG